MTSGIEIVLEAELEAFNTLQEQLNGSPWLAEVEERCELEDALEHTVKVSDAVRLACEQEMRDGQRNNWRTL